jgi:large subunit ribosomal protein L19
MHSLHDFDQPHMKKDLPHFKSGDTLKVFCKVKEGDKERIQLYEGVVIARHNQGISSTFTVRKTSYGVGVERIFPLHAPFIDRIEVSTQGKVRRAKLYYLRKLSGKKARIQAIDTRGQKEAIPSAPEATMPATPADTESSAEPQA